MPPATVETAARGRGAAPDPDDRPPGPCALGSLGDRAANVLTRLYATRVAGPDRVRYQAFHRTVANAGWALGGLAAAAALPPRHQHALPLAPHRRRALLRRRRAPHPALRGTPVALPHRRRLDGQAWPTTGPANPWSDRTYLADVATETVLFLHDTVFKVGLPHMPPSPGNSPSPWPRPPPRGPISASTDSPSPSSAASGHSPSPRPLLRVPRAGPPSARPSP